MAKIIMVTNFVSTQLHLIFFEENIWTMQTKSVLKWSKSEMVYVALQELTVTCYVSGDNG